MAENKSYLGHEIKQQLIENLESSDPVKAKRAENTLSKYWYSDYKEPNPNTYYYVCRESEDSNVYILLRDESKMGGC